METDRSPWAVVGIGCAGLMVALALAFAGFLYVGQRTARSVKAQLLDPDLRRTSAESLLHAEALPEGYEATLSLSVPLLGRVAVLEQRSHDRGLFLYLEDRGTPSAPEARDERLQRLLQLRGLSHDSGEIVATGDFVIGTQALSFRTSRGRLRHPPKGEREVLTALVDIECRPSQKTARLGVWIGPDQPDLAGTPADPEALRKFLSAFKFCN